MVIDRFIVDFNHFWVLIISLLTEADITNFCFEFEARRSDSFYTWVEKFLPYAFCDLNESWIVRPDRRSKVREHDLVWRVRVWRILVLRMRMLTRITVALLIWLHLLHF